MVKQLVVVPIGDRVLVEPIKEDTKSSAGIIIPDTVSKDKPREGKVLAIGELKEVTGIRVGDRVLFSDYGFDEIKVEGVEYYIIQSKNVLAKIN